MFLEKVTVSHFANSIKRMEPIGKGLRRAKMRKIIVSENQNPQEVFTVIGVSSMKEGYTDYLGSDEGYTFVQTGYHKVYIVARSIGCRFKVLCEHVKPVEGNLPKALDEIERQVKEIERLRGILDRFVTAFAVGDAVHGSLNGRSWSTLEDARQALAGDV